jgi:hypothetical protein
MLLAPTLLLNAGSGAAIARPTFSRDFAGEKTLNNGTGPAITFTRASNATFFDANGTLQTAANDTPRFDHDPATAGNPSRGLLIEESRTNSIRNSQAGGAATGTPGTAPTNWSTSVASSTSLAREIVGTGTEAGLSYVDFKFSGTPTTNDQVYVVFEGNLQVVGVAGQTWTTSLYCKLSGGSLTNIASVRIQQWYYNDSNVFVGFTQAAAITPTSSLQRFQHSGEVPAGATRVRPHIIATYTNGNPIDLTLRIAAPQLEQGAFATSYIPTTSAAATRAADFARVTPISSFYNQGEGTLFGEFSKFQMTANSKVAMFFDPINTARYGGLENDGGTPTTNRFIYQNNAGSTVASISFASAAANTVYRNCGGYASDNFQAAQNGTLGTADTSGTPADTLSHFGVGCLASTNGQFFLNGHIRRIAYYPRRLSNTLLQQLTT